MKDLKDLIEQGIKRKGFTKALIYNEIGKTQSGFEYALKNSTFSLKEFDSIRRLLDIDPNIFFEVSTEIDQYQVNEPMESYRKVKNSENKMLKSDTTEVEFLRSQVRELTAIIGELSRKVESK